MFLWTDDGGEKDSFQTVYILLKSTEIAAVQSLRCVACASLNKQSFHIISTRSKGFQTHPTHIADKPKPSTPLKP